MNHGLPIWTHTYRKMSKSTLLCVTPLTIEQPIKAILFRQIMSLAGELYVCQ